VKEGDPAEVEIDAIPEKKFKAQVVEVARNATVKNAGTEQEITTFIVRMALTEPVQAALPGMSAQASVSTDTRQDAVVVPIQAVTVRAEKDLKEAMRKVVFVMADGEAHIRAVETGLASDSEIEIVSGLKAGEKVIEGPYKILSRELSDGKKVKEEEPKKPGDEGQKAKGS
jgi:HlyD family secretion protein